jgi:hypothetical protein
MYVQVHTNVTGKKIAAMRIVRASTDNVIPIVVAKFTAKPDVCQAAKILNR